MKQKKGVKKRGSSKVFGKEILRKGGGREYRSLMGQVSKIKKAPKKEH